MAYRGSIAALIAAAALGAALSFAQAAEDAKYPNLRGQWLRVDKPDFGPPGEKPPLTAEYQAIYDANRADMKAGGVGIVPSTFCYPMGMPMMMNVYDPLEIIVTPETTYILQSHVNDSYRRIYTDGRDFPTGEDSTFAGYSIGKWVDTGGDGRYDELQVETRNLRGPRVLDATGIPLHSDNQTVIKERIFLGKDDPNMLYDELTVIDHALTRPWTVMKRAKRNQEQRPVWRSDACAEGNVWVKIGKEAYYLDPEGTLMPIKKDQSPPDLRYFKQTQTQK